MGKKLKFSPRTYFSEKTRKKLMGLVHSYAVEVVNILEHSRFDKIMIYIDPVLTRLKCEWGTSDPNIIAAAMYKYGYIEGKSDTRRRGVKE